jgi:hypothetical protein
MTGIFIPDFEITLAIQYDTAGNFEALTYDEEDIKWFPNEVDYPEEMAALDSL